MLETLEKPRTAGRGTVERLLGAIEEHDAETSRHVRRMASISGMLAAKLGLRSRTVRLVQAAAPMHDVGKLATPRRILRKPGPLTPFERTQIARHAAIGYRLLLDSASDLMRMAATIALTHHERFDGSGYPLGLKGEEIPLEGRIVAVADVFDALLSDRCYRPALSVEETVEVIRDERGTHFDPEVADVLLENLDQALALRAA